MSLPIAFATYFVLWFVALLVVLPFGVRTQGEAGSVVPGTPASAPAAYAAAKVLRWTTLVSAVAFLVVYALVGTTAGRSLIFRLFGHIGITT